MVTLNENISLKELSTFKIAATARYYAEIQSPEEITSLYKEHPFLLEIPHYILGDGSNTLFSKDFDGLVLHLTNSGIQTTSETDTDITITVAAGHNWHKLVEWSVEKGYGGIENLALIPGTVGAAPIQNIAAYGQNFSDTCTKVYTFDLKDHTIRVFEASECAFNYRTSIFKQQDKSRYIVTAVELRLQKHPSLATEYFEISRQRSSIQEELKSIASPPYTPKDIFQAVINIRQRKLPDIKTTPTVGSFFLNPVVSKEKLKELLQQIPDLQYYPIEDLKYDATSVESSNLVKVAAGRLIDELGWRGKKVGNCWMYEKHALVPTHNGNATGQEMLAFTNMIKDDVLEKFGIGLQPEVNIL